MINYIIGQQDQADLKAYGDNIDNGIISYEDLGIELEDIELSDDDIEVEEC